MHSSKLSSMLLLLLSFLSLNGARAFGAEGKLVCLERETGKLVWQRDTAKDWNVPEAFFGVGSTPLLEGDKLIVMVGGQPNSAVVALDPTTGRTIWENVGRTNWQGAASRRLTRGSLPAPASGSAISPKRA